MTREVREAVLSLKCEECSAMPGQQCRRTRDQGFHMKRRLEAAKVLGLRISAGPQ